MKKLVTILAMAMAAAQECGHPDVAANEGYRTITVTPEGGGAA